MRQGIGQRVTSGLFVCCASESCGLRVDRVVCKAAYLVSQTHPAFQEVWQCAGHSWLHSAGGSGLVGIPGFIMGACLREPIQLPGLGACWVLRRVNREHIACLLFGIDARDARKATSAGPRCRSEETCQDSSLVGDLTCLLSGWSTAKHHDSATGKGAKQSSLCVIEGVDRSICRWALAW